MKYLILFLSFFSVMQIHAGDVVDDSSGVDKAVYDNAIRDGKSTTEASRLAGGYAPGTSDNITGGAISNDQFRNGNFTIKDIPIFIAGVTKFVIEIAGTVAIFALIYHAVQMQINSGITGDSSGVDKAKKGMYSSLIGFIVALLSWFIVTRVVEILTTATS